MKKNILIKSISTGFLLALLLFSCKEDKPKGDEFCWSPDGKKLVVVNVESKELVLVELQDDKIEKAMPIDSYSGKKAKIYSPAWSPDAEYVLFARSSQSSLEIKVYSLHENRITTIDRIPANEKEEWGELVFVSWLPKMNRVLWLSWNSFAERRLFSALPNGTDRKILIKLVGDKVIPPPACSPGGEWIAYSVHAKKGDARNGLWKMKSDGSGKELIFPANEITAFQWQPDGSHLALVNKAVTQTSKEQGKSDDSTFHYRLSLIDSEGNNERLLSEENLPIGKLAWSPDGKQLAFFQQQDNSSDVWVVNLDSNQKVKMNFNKVQDFLGWGSSNQLFFTTDYPKDLTTETKQQKDARELFEALHGTVMENLLVKNAKSQRQNLTHNISAYAWGGLNGAVAYYQTIQPNFVGSEVYCPIIQFASGEHLHLARTNAQFSAAADEYYLTKKYQSALELLSRYWNVDFNGTNFRDVLNISQRIERLKTDPDSSHYKRSYEALKDGSLLKTMLTLRQLHRADEADWLWQQIQQFILHIDSTSTNPKEMLDDIFWASIGAYSRYNEPLAGISDFDRWLQADNLDSNVIAFTNYAQAILAIQAKQYDLSLQKMESAITYLSPALVDLDDIKGMLSLCCSKLDAKKNGRLVPILQRTIQRFPDNRNLFQIYDMLGDVYLRQGHREKALEAFQMATTLNFDRSEIWEKILCH